MDYEAIVESRFPVPFPVLIAMLPAPAVQCLPALSPLLQHDNVWQTLPDRLLVETTVEAALICDVPWRTNLRVTGSISEQSMSKLD